MTISSIIQPRMTGACNSRCKSLTCLLLLVLVLGAVRPAEGAGRSRWDDNLLSIEIVNASMEASDIVAAWEEVSRKYLLRANLYMVSDPKANLAPFAFRKEKATGKDLLDAFIATYSSYTYTQAPKTGVLWIYPKRIEWNSILNQKITVARSARQIRMSMDVYIPLCNLLAPDLIDSNPRRIGGFPIAESWLYDMDLPAGVYSAREILDLCCVANPTKAFLANQKTRLMCILTDLYNMNPLAPPRVGAVKFWELEVGKSTNGIPSLQDIRVALSSSVPEKRLAASLYLEACARNYAPVALIEKADSSEQAVWTALGVQYALWRDAEKRFFTSLATTFPRLREDLKKIEDPKLALLASLQLTRENQDTTSLDGIVRAHTFTESEIASIKPEIVRMARSSKEVRDKLLAMKLPQFSPEALRELENTNFFTRVPPQ